MVVWAKAAGGTGTDEPYGIATDATGNIYITGNFGSSSITFGTVTLTSPGFFLTKYDANGNVLWAKSAGGSAYSNSGNAVATDASGNVFVTGSFPSSLSFGTTTLTNTDNPDIFIVKYDASGTVLWARGSTSSSGGDYSYGGGIATDANGKFKIFLCRTGDW